METQELIFQLSDADEQIVRTYQCTRLKRWFAPPMIGYLTITNKRIVFYSSGKSLTGRSLLINEMPLEDAVGLSVYEGLSINWALFLVFTIVVYIATQFIANTLPFLVSYELAILLMLPFAIIWLLSSNILSEQVKEQIFQTVDRIGQERYKVSRDLSTYLPQARILLFIGLAILAWRIAFNSGYARGGTVVSWLLLLAVYGFIFMRFFGRQHTFSLRIGSKTMKGSGIYIPGDTFRLFSTRDTTALQALGASPAVDASQVTRELGALLLDIQQLGDLGIAKWKR